MEIPFSHGRKGVFFKKIPILLQDETLLQKKKREKDKAVFPRHGFPEQNPVFEEQDGEKPSRQADGKPAAQNRSAKWQSGNFPMEISCFPKAGEACAFCAGVGDGSSLLGRVGQPVCDQ